MAPKAFKKVNVAVSGTFPGYKQADLKALVENQGATFSSSVSSECTHLVTTQKDVEKKSAKYKTACDVNTCEIVNLDWLLESVKAKKPLATKKYLFSSDGSGDGDKNGTKDSKNGKDHDSKQDGDEKKSSKKRTLDDALDDANDASGADEDESNKKLKDGQKASSKKLNIPIDEGCFLGSGGYAVYIDDSGLIWDATLNQTNSGANNNKFYRIQLLVDSASSRYKTWTRWGRVGEYGQNHVLGDGSFQQAQAEFQKKFKDKSGLTWDNRLAPPKPKKYTFIERNYEESDDEEEDDKPDKKKAGKEKQDEEEKPVESTLPVPIQNLMTFIFNQQHFLSAMASMSYDARKLPLGKLSKRTLLEGFQVLQDLSELITTPANAPTKYGTDFRSALETLSNRYFTIIPHVFGRNRPPLLETSVLLKREVDLLEALTDMGVTNEIMKGHTEAERINELDRQFNSLGLQEMTIVEPDTAEYKELENYLNHSRGATHHLRYNVVNIFRIERQGENERFEKAYGNISNSNRRLLWHGSRSTNYGGILSQGLRIAPPEAPVNGYMFGKGVYLADTSSKSANYCWSHSSANMGLLLLCDVELGDPMYEQNGSNYNAATDSKAAGALATLGCGCSVPAGWKDAGCVHPGLQGVQMPDVALQSAQRQASLLYNEYIVYDVKQIRQKYLFHVHMR